MGHLRLKWGETFEIHYHRGLSKLRNWLHLKQVDRFLHIEGNEGCRHREGKKDRKISIMILSNNILLLFLWSLKTADELCSLSNAVWKMLNKTIWTKQIYISRMFSKIQRANQVWNNPNKMLVFAFDNIGVWIATFKNMTKFLQTMNVFISSFKKYLLFGRTH